MLKMLGVPIHIGAGQLVREGRMVSEPTVVQPVTDVTEWSTYFAPDDDIHGVLLAELQNAVKLGAKCEVHSSQYGFTDQDIADCMQTLALRNPACRYLFDKTQEAGHYENPIVKAMLAPLQSNQWAIGTSKKGGQILHTKAEVLLYPDGTGWTMTGSFNLSKSAESQFNIVDVVRSRSRAELFANRIDAMFDWVKTNQGDNQP